MSQQVTPVDKIRARQSLEPAIKREAAINAPEGTASRLRAAQPKRRSSLLTWDTSDQLGEAIYRSVAEATDNGLLLALFDQLNQVRRAVT